MCSSGLWLQHSAEHYALLFIFALVSGVLLIFENFGTFLCTSMCVGLLLHQAKGRGVLSEQCQWSCWHSSRMLNGSYVHVHKNIVPQSGQTPAKKSLGTIAYQKVTWLPDSHYLNNIQAHSLGCVCEVNTIFFVFRPCASVLFPVEHHLNEGTS